MLFWPSHALALVMRFVILFVLLHLFMSRLSFAQQQWLLHCPGAVAFARDAEHHSASTEFYIVIGQGTRHLD